MVVRAAGLTLVAFIGAGILAGCAPAGAPDPVPTVTVTVTASPHPDESDGPDAGEYGREAVCALGDAGISLIEAGGAAAQALAVLVADNVTEGRIRDLAIRVRDGSDTAEVRAELGSLLGAYCA